MFPIDFYKGKKVFITGHTGFKGTWLSRMLIIAGAQVTGYALEPLPDSPSLFALTDTGLNMRSVWGDIRDINSIKKVFEETRPEIVFHLAAQPIVRTGYADPAYTYETNVMGTVNILECIRLFGCTASFINVTTDKVYENREWVWGYRETENLDGFDPYSNSKSCSELVTHCYNNSFFKDSCVKVSTVRAGNVIGGGDFARDRIIPDCMRAAIEGRDVIIRNPLSIRPYQFVLEPLYVYLMIAARQYEDRKYSGWYNVGPEEADCIQTGELADAFILRWGKGMKRITQYDGGPHEANYLKLDCSKLKAVFGWKPRVNIYCALDMTVDWLNCYISGDNTTACLDRQIGRFLNNGVHNDTFSGVNDV